MKTLVQWVNLTLSNPKQRPLWSNLQTKSSFGIIHTVTIISLYVLQNWTNNFQTKVCQNDQLLTVSILCGSKGCVTFSIFFQFFSALFGANNPKHRLMKWFSCSKIFSSKKCYLKYVTYITLSTIGVRGVFLQGGV